MNVLFYGGNLDLGCCRCCGFEVNSGTYFGCGGGTLFFCGRKNPDLFCWSGLKQCGSGTQFCRTDVASSAVLAFEFKAVFLWAVSGSCWLKGEA